MNIIKDGTGLLVLIVVVFIAILTRAFLIKNGSALIIIIISVLIIILVRSFIINLSKLPLTKVEFEESDKDIVTIWLDGGVVVKADKDNDFWKDQIVIDQEKLAVGSDMVIYNLSKFAVRRSSYLVLKVEKKTLR